MAQDDKYFKWHGPSDFSGSKLRLNNSFTGKKDPFVPHDGGNRITWYICGPTVYDSSHVGHASNYVRFDIIRRILSDYFGYDVVVQMNVTDIDDKIIKRSNERNIPFEQLARQFEDEFMEDMDTLNVLRPTFLTRVSEYIPEVVEYIETIIKNGYAYESEGSVYFDTVAFQTEGHDYGKLEPWSVGNEALLAEGEGALTSGDAAVKTQKKNAGDFVLWKRSKPQEPTWDSPWGPGRPGWHIECSAMASNVLGSVIDIHAGGIDLRFPHHSNEVAQAEAYHQSHQWVNYFLHSGHLDIDGCKMSKSLKNFITIRECLKRYNARAMRIAFLAHRYDSPMSYAEHGMEEAVNVDRSFTAFFGTVKATLREIAKCDTSKRTVRPTEVELALEKELHHRKTKVHERLADNIDTPGAFLELQGLVRSTNAYMNEKGTSSNALLLEQIGRYLSRMFRIFGLTGSPQGDISYGEEGGESVSRELALAPVLDSFCMFRDEIRRMARAETSETSGKILSLCDHLRDEVMPELGVRLEDRAGTVSVWKLENKETLLREIAEKKRSEELAKVREEQRKAQAAAKRQADLEKGRVAPKDMFRLGDYKGKYSEYDEEGMPTMDAEGKALSKSALKNLRKARIRQEKLHLKFLEAAA